MLYSLTSLIVLLGVIKLVNGANDDVCTTAECVQAAGSILLAMDTSADPCQNFYQYACGNFEMRQNIPAGERRFGQFTVLDKLLKKQLRSILDDPSATIPKEEFSARRKMWRYYQSCMDLTSVNKNNVRGMQQVVAKLGGLLLTPSDVLLPKSWNLNTLLANFDTYNSGGALFGVSVDTDDKNVTGNIISFSQGRLFLGRDTRDYYINKAVTEDTILVALTDMLAKFAKVVLGEKAAINRSLIIDVLQFDKKRAEIQQTRTELNDRLATYTKVNITWLQDNFNFMNWNQYMTGKFDGVNVTLKQDEPIVLFAVSYFKRLTSLVNNYLKTAAGKRTLQNYFTLRVITSHAAYFGDAFQAPYDAFQAVFSGKKGSQERWEMCMNDVDGSVGFPLAALYVSKYFPPKAKQRAQTVMADTIKTFRSRIQGAAWMDEETRKRALEKIDSVDYIVAYPDWLFNETYMNNRYSKLIVTDDYIENQFTAISYFRYRDLSKLRDPVDRTEWYMTPPTVNAYYDPTINTVVIPAGILSSPFFYAADGLPSALNFGAIGGIAGHEITHGFDNIGRQYDKVGNLKDWWNPESSARFHNRSVCFVEKFNDYIVDGIHVKGNQTLSENIADAGGVKVAYTAYKKFEQENRDIHTKLVGLPGLTPDKLFFLGWAQAWCMIQTPAASILQVQTDVHSPNHLRVIGPLSNSDDFAAAYNCAPGFPMNSKKKCVIW